MFSHFKLESLFAITIIKSFALRLVTLALKSATAFGYLNSNDIFIVFTTWDFELAFGALARFSSTFSNLTATIS